MGSPNSENLILGFWIQTLALGLRLVNFFTSSKQSSRHSGLLTMSPLTVLPMSQFQKHSSFPPVVMPHIGSFSSLYLLSVLSLTP